MWDIEVSGSWVVCESNAVGVIPRRTPDGFFSTEAAIRIGALFSSSELLPSHVAKHKPSPSIYSESRFEEYNGSLTLVKENLVPILPEKYCRDY